MISFNVFSVIVSIIIGLAVDWAVFQRIANLIPNAFSKVKEIRYLDHSKYRLILTVFGSIVFLFGISSQYRNIYLTFGGGLVFLTAHILAYISIYTSQQKS